MAEHRAQPPANQNTSPPSDTQMDRAAASIAFMVDEWIGRGWNEDSRARFAKLVKRRLRRFFPAPEGHTTGGNEDG